MRRDAISSKLARILVSALCIVGFAYLIFPISIVIPISFSSSEFLQFPPKSFSLRWYQAYFTSEDWVRATLQSFKVAVLAMIISSIIGTLCAFGLVRGRFRGKKIIQILNITPVIVPQIIFAIGIYFQFASWHLVGKTIGLVLAHLPLAIPFVVITVSATLYNFDICFEEAAQTLGANKWKTFIYVTYPLIQPGILSGAIFAFITSFDELIVALFLCGTRSVTLPKAMFDTLKYEISPVIASVSSLLILLAILVLIGIAALRNRSVRIETKMANGRRGDSTP